MEVEPYFRNAYGNLSSGGWNSVPVTRTPAMKRKLVFKSKPKYSKKQKVGSRTRTTLSSKKGRQIPTGGGDSVSYFTRVNKPTSLIVKLSKESPVSTVIQNSAGRQEAAVGTQTYTSIGDFFTSTDLNLGHVLLVGNAAGGAQSTKTAFHSVHSECMMTNQSNTNCRMTIYDVICRKDTDATVTDPTTAISTAYNDIVNGAASNAICVGSTPFSMPRFTEYFKVEQVTSVTLSPGACHVHKVHIALNKLISKTISVRIAGSGVQGITRYSFVRFHGSPQNDITTQTQVSTSQVSIDWVNSEEYKFRNVVTSLPFTDVNDNLPAAFTVAGATMQDDGVELPANEA